MALTGKQVRQLRSLAHHLSPVIIIGKAVDFSVHASDAGFQRGSQLTRKDIPHIPECEGTFHTRRNTAKAAASLSCAEIRKPLYRDAAFSLFPRPFFKYALELHPCERMV